MKYPKHHLFNCLPQVKGFTIVKVENNQAIYVKDEVIQKCKTKRGNQKIEAT